MNKEDIKLFFKGFVKVFKPFFMILLGIIFVAITFNVLLHFLVRFEALGILLATTITFLIWGGIVCGVAEVERNKSIDVFNNRHNSSRPRVHKK